jgi:hypothetical protein
VFNSGNIIGKSVWIEFGNDQLHAKFEKMGLLQPTEFTKIIGMDERGLWCENAEYFSYEIPTDKGVIKQHSPLVFFVPWQFVITLAVATNEKDIRNIENLGFRRPKSRGRKME